MKVLITGGTGSLGTALVERWYGQHRLTILSRDPGKQAALKNKYPELRLMLTDICEYQQVEYACKGQDVLIHAAALKFVSEAEPNFTEYVRVNIEGTKTVARAWRNTHREPCPVDGLMPVQPRKALLISTDKAVSSLNGYGMTKAVAERIFVDQFGYNAVRYGNVVTSRGSVFEMWQHQIEQGKPITIRMGQPNNESPTRFYLAMSDAVKLIEAAIAAIGRNINGIFVPVGLSAFSIADAAEATLAQTEVRSICAYEKLHESLLSPGEGIVVYPDILQDVYIGNVHAPWWPLSDDYYTPFCSNTAPRMSGTEVLEAVGWRSQ